MPRLAVFVLLEHVGIRGVGAKADFVVSNTGDEDAGYIVLVAVIGARLAAGAARLAGQLDAATLASIHLPHPYAISPDDFHMLTNT